MQHLVSYLAGGSNRLQAAAGDLAGLPVEEPRSASPIEIETLSQTGSMATLGEMRLTIVIFLFGVLAIGLFLLLSRGDRSTPMVLRLYVIIILVVGTLLVVSSAYSTSQIAPVVGFFGTIAGYLLGRTDRPGDPK